MPHIIVEHSADVAGRAALEALCTELYAALAAHPAITKPETLKLRTRSAGAHLLGTRGQSFAHATLRLLPGRDADTRSDLAQVILNVMERELPKVHSLTVDLADLDPAYAKRVLPDQPKERTMDDQTRIELEAAAFRALRHHLMETRTDVQNIDMMNLTGFCRNCLSRWYQEAANARGIDMSKDEARQTFYGMTTDEWKAQHQTEASPAQQDAFKTSFAENVEEKS